MRPPEFTGGNARQGRGPDLRQDGASMRPPEFTGGNPRILGEGNAGRRCASMRPPEFTGGNHKLPSVAVDTTWCCFNEAAGIHRRKRAEHRSGVVNDFQELQ